MLSYIVCDRVWQCCLTQNSPSAIFRQITACRRTRRMHPICISSRFIIRSVPGNWKLLYLSFGLDDVERTETTAPVFWCWNCANVCRLYQTLFANTFPTIQTLTEHPNERTKSVQFYMNSLVALVRKRTHNWSFKPDSKFPLQICWNTLHIFVFNSSVLAACGQ